MSLVEISKNQITYMQHYRGMHSTRELHPWPPAFLPPTQESAARGQMPNVGILNFRSDIVQGRQTNRRNLSELNITSRPPTSLVEL